MKYHLAALALISLGSAALAADLPLRTPPLAPAPVEYRTTGWAGLYGGIHAGYSTGIRSSLTTNAYARESKSIGRGECQDASGQTVPPNQGGSNPANCTLTTVPNTYTFVPSAPYTSSYTSAVAGTPYASTYTGGQVKTCVVTSGPAVGTYTNIQNANACAAIAGSSVGSPSVCTISSGPNAGTYNNAYNNAQQCSNFAGNSPNVCTATSGTSSGQTYSANSANQCANLVGTREVATGNEWVMNSDLFASSAMAAATQIGRSEAQFFGLSLGYNYQTGNVVLGVEADASFLRNGRRDRYSLSEANLENVDGPGQSQVPLYTNMATFAQGRFGVSNFATLRARIGYAFTDNLLVFATGGFATGNVVMQGSTTYSGDWGIGKGNNDPRATFGASQNFDKSGYKFGYTLGAGVNYKVTDNIVLGLTYLYVDLGKYSASSSFAFQDGLTRGNQNPNAPNNSFQVEAKGSSQARINAAFHTVRLSAQYRFTTGDDVPVLARY